MTIKKRMMHILGEEQSQPKPYNLSSLTDMPDSKDIYARAAQILAIGLHQDLPDGAGEATSHLVDVMKVLIRKRYYLRRALQIMGRRSQARAFTRKLAREF